jgi:PEP-CTERM motif
MRRRLPGLGSQIALAVVGLSLSIPAHASITFADFGEVLEKPDFPLDLGPRQLFAGGVDLTAVTTNQLTEADEVSNPTGYAGALQASLDTTSNVLSLAAVNGSTDPGLQGDQAYQIVTFTLANIVDPGNYIVSVTPMSIDNALNFDYTLNITVWSYNVTIQWVSNQLGNNGYIDLLSDEGGIDTFQLADAPIPEPATFGIAGAGLLFFAYLGRRRYRRAA